ncbi:MAG: hypothetical protein Q9227_007755 [Pyrenula ochraceoflavens]
MVSFPLFAIFSATLLFSLVSGKGFWSSSPAPYSDIIRQAYPVGNGRLGAMPFGLPGSEKVNLNIDSLWSGGPFENTSYTGGNPTESKAAYLPGIRNWIFRNGTGNVTELYDDALNYGSYAVAGNLSVSLSGIGASYTAYNRSLDFDTGSQTVVFQTNASSVKTTVYCSYPDAVCVYSVSSTTALPEVTISLENLLLDESLVTTSCSTSEQYVRLRSLTQANIGMRADMIARVVSSNSTAVSTLCRNSTDPSSSSTSAALVIPASVKTTTFTLVIGGGTDYDSSAGNAAHDFSFRGDDPASYVESTTSAAASKSASELYEAHIADYQPLAHAFTLDLPDTAGSSGLETSKILANYNLNSTSGDPYLESLMQAYARHLFISSSRPGSLPPNLQGIWATDLSNAWSADYHANINLQMNHWAIPSTGLSALQSPLFTYMAQTWAPRGSLTAQLLYGTPPNSSAWVVHDEMNIFGHTAMKNDAQWANYPVSAAWMMTHVFDQYDYNPEDTAFWASEGGYPLMRGVAAFWLTQLQPDAYFNDGTLVVNPCNSPEHGPTTFGCTHYQQLISELFANILTSAPEGEDEGFLRDVQSALSRMDRGIHIGSWGQIQEWKLDIDVEGDTHRHLSELYGWYPGYSLVNPSAVMSSMSGSNATRNGNTTNTIPSPEAIASAVETTLISRGPGDGPDADAGWEKIWRSTCYARLNASTPSYTHLRFALSENLAPNGLSMYSAHNPPFQIDANFGINGAVVEMLIRDIRGSGEEGEVVLAPAIPRAWWPGKVQGVRVRGGGVVGFEWDEEGRVRNVGWEGGGGRRRRKVVDREGKVLLE